MGNYVYKAVSSSGSVVRSQTMETFRLTDGLRPLHFNESVGFFAEPYRAEKVIVEFRLGLGATQVIADHQFRIDSVDQAAQVITVRSLESYDQIGLEFSLRAQGKIDVKSSYELGYETLIPFLSLRNGDREALKSHGVLGGATQDVFAKLSTKFYESISLSCEYRLRKQPFLLDKTQSQSLTLMNFTYTLL